MPTYRESVSGKGIDSTKKFREDLWMGGKKVGFVSGNFDFQNLPTLN